MKTDDKLQLILEQIMKMRLGEADSDLRSLVSFVEDLKDKQTP